MELLPKGWNAYRLLLVPFVLVVYSPVNWTLRSVAYSLQNGCLASIGTSYNEDSERYFWGLTVRCCRNGVLVSHVSWVWEARVADRFEPLTQQSTPSFFGNAQTRRDRFGLRFARKPLHRFNFQPDGPPHIQRGRPGSHE